jgi:uncharacterized membrane protein
MILFFGAYLTLGFSWQLRPFSLEVIIAFVLPYIFYRLFQCRNEDNANRYDPPRFELYTKPILSLPFIATLYALLTNLLMTITAEMGKDALIQKFNKSLEH